MPSTTQLRRDVELLAYEASGDIARLWRSTEGPAQAELVLRDVLPDLLAAYGAAAATVAADWYDDTREERQVSRTFTAVPADIPDVGAQSLIGWALTESHDLAGFQSLILGGSQRRIANFSRLTVSQSAVADPSAQGWKRVGRGGCDFCSMLISRGAVYREATASFRAHDHCNCVAAPVWR